MTTIHTMTATDADERDTTVTLHPGRAAAEAAVRINYDPAGEHDGLDIEELIDLLEVEQGVSIAIERHEIDLGGLRVSFAPAAIREHYAAELEDRYDGDGPDALAGLTDADLEAIGEDAMGDDAIWAAYGAALNDALLRHAPGA